MVHCLLVFPVPSRDSPNHNVALGMLFVGTMLERAGYSVRYLDMRFDDWSTLVQVLRDGVRVVGVSAMTGHQCGQAARIFNLAKRIDPKIVTVLGGVHATMVPNDTLDEPDIDYLVLGEGEETMVELVGAIAKGDEPNGIRGLAWKDRHGEVTVNPSRPFMDLADVPFPLTPSTRRFFEIAARTKSLSYYSSRGCPFRCTFCYNLVFNDRKWRQLPPAILQDHLTIMRREFAADHVYLVDDYIGHGKRRLSELAEAMARVGVTWHSSIRVSDITEEVAGILERGGCNSLLLGVESASRDVQQGVLLKDYKSGADDVRRCVQAISRTRIRPLYSFMYNVPGETDDDLEQSFALAEWIYRTDRRAMIGFYAYTPYPGTPLYQHALNSGFTPPKRLTDWETFSLSNELNPRLRDLYFIAGLRFRSRSGDRTDQNFPGLRRLQILPFELSSRVRWRTRRFVYSGVERHAVRTLIGNATRRSQTAAVTS
jgi:anaerobic magnesium-protoporphyrin IX monomethyl ester cyclase